MSKGFIIALVAVIGILGGIFIFTQDESSTSSAEVTNHTQGAGTAGVTLVEYGDFQCPACGAFHPLLQEVKSEFGDQITFQFRHFPLTQIHPNAFAAHRAAEAAGMQDKFWEMHDLLYERQQVWTGLSNTAAVETFSSYAEELGLNMEQYQSDYASTLVNDTINADIGAGQELGATSTPTFVLNGERLEENPRDAEAFKELIRQAIAEQNPEASPSPTPEPAPAQ